MRESTNATQGDRIGALAGRLESVEQKLAHERARPCPDMTRLTELEQRRLHLKDQLALRLSRSRKIRKARLAPPPGRSVAPAEPLQI